RGKEHLSLPQAPAGPGFPENLFRHAAERDRHGNRMTDLLAVAPAILALVAALVCWVLTRGRSERGQAAGTLSFTALLALAAVLALWGLLSIGIGGFRASVHLGFLERLTVAVDAVQDAAISGRLPGLAFVTVIAIAVL